MNEGEFEMTTSEGTSTEARTGTTTTTESPLGGLLTMIRIGRTGLRLAGTQTVETREVF